MFFNCIFFTGKYELWIKIKGREALFSNTSILRMLSRDNSKLCFELLEILSAAQNNLPLRRGLKNLQSRFFL